MIHDLISTAEKVTDEGSFVRLLQLMAATWEDQQAKEKRNPPSPYSTGANGWESGSIGQFLESAAAWAEDTSSGADLASNASDAWRRAAMIMLVGAFYE